ncbi:carbohydrate ABC transporter permease [Pseudonocardia sp. MH-G8]|uniref:carbohydrate ABC transporter permease n=1 Tax=Pseudonocardia sp. MH-G8 TaxID=1854588 RepID=UPI000BA16C4A|nr:carbohydrate ABC transporter permease [Pseudonocardia sp. MH-G8]OZM78023.1 ABC transporter permease [Pseudonocardia sp. MH-G8]
MSTLVNSRASGAGRTPTLPARGRRTRTGSLPGAVVTTVVALLWLVVVAAPMYYMLVVSMLGTDAFLSSNPWFPFGDLTLANYAAVLESGFARYLLNSVIVSGGATLLAVVVSVFAAYAIVVRAGRLTGLFFQIFLIGFAVPIQALMIPLYIEVIALGLYDSLLGLILPMAAFSLPITVLILVNFLREVPPSLIQAMQLDGAGPVRILRSLAVPISMPAIATVAIFDFITAWNNFLFPLILTQSPGAATLPLAVFEFQGNRFADVPPIMACVALSILPLFALYIVARRQISTALAAGFGS